MTSSNPLLSTLGIDLASAADKTAFALVEWTPKIAFPTHPSDYHGQLTQLNLQGSDSDLLQFRPHSRCLIGLDAPLGWPTPFIEYISTPLSELSRHSDKAPWTPSIRDQMRYRQTDRYTRSVLGRWPLSVSTDYLSLVGLRARGLLRAWEISNITGQEYLFEVYPAVALKRWGLTHRGYKGKGIEKEQLRRSMLTTLSASFELTLSSYFQDQLIQSDHGFDALICCLITWYAHFSLCDLPSTEKEIEASQHEGWIYIPKSL